MAARTDVSGRHEHGARIGSYGCVKIRPRKACNYPNWRSSGWVSYDKVGVFYSGKFGIRSEARASDLGSYPGLWWNRIKLRPYTHAVSGLDDWRTLYS